MRDPNVSNSENSKSSETKMPRGSKPGERRGGRQRGTPNKKTALRNAAIAAAASNPDISPLEFLLGVMRDPNVSPDLRIKVAQAAAPFVHAKPGNARPGDGAASVTFIEGVGHFAIEPALAKGVRDDQHRLDELGRKRYSPGGPLSAAEIKEEIELRARIADRASAISCPVGYGPKQDLNDRNRLHTLHCKRLRPSSCGGGVLSEAEDTEEAQLEARVAAFEHSPEGRARSRIFELQQRRFAAFSVAERDELKDSMTRYPEPPLDPDQKARIEFWRSAVERSRRS
jgi:hypothetical protein